MNVTPKTIQIFLPGGTPRGIRPTMAAAAVTARFLHGWTERRKSDGVTGDNLTWADVEFTS